MVPDPFVRSPHPSGTTLWRQLSPQGHGVTHPGTDEGPSGDPWSRVLSRLYPVSETWGMGWTSGEWTSYMCQHYRGLTGTSHFSVVLRRSALWTLSLPGVQDQRP